MTFFTPLPAALPQEAAVSGRGAVCAWRLLPPSLAHCIGSEAKGKNVKVNPPRLGDSDPDSSYFIVLV